MNGTCDDSAVWPPFCGEVYPEDKVAGEKVICTRLVHDADEKHFNEELWFEWW